MSNNRIRFSEKVIPYTRRVQLAKAKLVPKTWEEKKAAASERLHESWLEGFNKQKKALMTGKYGNLARILCLKLDSLHLDDGDLLIEMSNIWVSADRNTRHLVLQLIDSAMVELRQRNFLCPFDDPLEGDNAFLQIRKILS